MPAYTQNTNYCDTLRSKAIPIGGTFFQKYSTTDQLLKLIIKLLEKELSTDFPQARSLAFNPLIQDSPLQGMLTN